MKKILLSLIGILCSMSLWAEGTLKVSSAPAKSTAGVTVTSVKNITLTYGNDSGWDLGTASTTVNGQNFTKYVVGKQNPDQATMVGTIYKFSPAVNGTLTIVIQNANISGKTMILNEDGTDITGTLDDETEVTGNTKNTTAKGSATLEAYTGGLKISVKADNNYYFALAGSKVRFMGFIYEEEATSTATPSFTTNLSTTPYEAIATKQFSLSVVAADATGLQWYSCDDAQKTNAQAIDGATSQKYTFTPAAGDANTTKYFYCVATNDNATGDKTATSNVATVNIVENQSYVVTWQNVGGWSLRAPNGEKSGSEFDKNTSIALTADEGASYHFVKWTVNDVEVSTSTAYTHTVTEAATIKGIYEANKKLIFEGTNQEAYADKNGNITVPQNWYHYQTGKTVISWTGSDGNTYVPGEQKVLSENVTLTPNYTTTKKQLAYGATVTWSFAFPNSCPLFNSIQGAGATRNYVQQANINGTNLDVNMVCDATAGKMDNARRMTNDLTQVNNGTKFTIPAVTNMTVTVNANGNMSATTIDGSTSYTGKGTKSITYTYTGSEEAIDIVINDGSYLSSIVVTYPKTAEDPTKPTLIAKWDTTNKVGTWDFAGKATDAQDIKINTNTTTVKGIKFESGLISSKVLTNYAKVTIDGGFKAGDIVTFAGAYNNSAAKTAAIAIADAEANVLFVSAPCINGRLVNDTPKVETYTLTSDFDELYIGRDATGETSTYLTSFSVSRPATVTTPSINAQGYGTFSSEYNVQITGAKAYTAKLDGTTITCTEIPNGLVPAGEGVLLYGTPSANATALYVASAPVVSDNDLKATTLADGSLAAIESSLVLSGNTFMTYTGGTFAAGKAYFPYAGSAKSFRIVFTDNGQTTGINTAAAAQKVANAKFIENGRIVIVKDGAKYNVAGQVIK